MLKNFEGLDGFVWWKGVVEDRMDPLMLGRVRVRIFGLHTEDKSQIPTDTLPWAQVCLPIDHGNNVVGLREGDWVFGFFMDSTICQMPCVIGMIPGIPTQTSVPDVGFNDPTTPEQLSNGEVPRPPEFGGSYDFGSNFVTGMQDASKTSVNKFLTDVRYQVPVNDRTKIDNLVQQLPKFNSQSTLNLAQTFLNPSNGLSLLSEDLSANSFDNLINGMGISSAKNLSDTNRRNVTDGLNVILNQMSANPDLLLNFKDVLQSEVTNRITSYVNNIIPPEVSQSLSTLGPSSPINLILSNIQNGGTFEVTQLFNGDVVSNVSSVITALIPINNPLEMISRFGRSTAQKISEFLGLDFGANDEELVPIEFENERESNDPLRNENKLFTQGTAVGVLQKDFDIQNFPYDVNNDGVYDEADAELLRPSATSTAEEQSSATYNTPVYSASRYPLEPYLNEPVTPRLARNQKIEDTIVGKKNSNVSSFSAAAYEPVKGMKLSPSLPRIVNPQKTETKGETKDQLPVEGEPFEEPATPYAAKWPYNHVYQSESGHYIEIDDTPKAERLHWYHRSGTFREIHPDGTLVDKCLNKLYTISVADMYIASNKNINLTSDESTKIKSETELTIESGSTTISTGGLSIKSGTTFQEMEGGHAQKIADNKEVEVGGDYVLKVDGKVKIIADTIAFESLSYISMRAASSIIFESPTIGNNTASFNVAGVANLFPTFSPIYTPNLEPSFIPEAESTTEQTSSNFKPGFRIRFSNGSYDPSQSNYLYKPKADSDGKPVVLVPPGSGPIVMYEALPTGELETFFIYYDHAPGDFSQWQVTAPKHRKGNVIERPRFAGNANGGRDHYRFSKYAKDYPKQFIISDNTREFLVYDGKFRHD